jgi:DNA recombination protein RmuC
MDLITVTVCLLLILSAAVIAYLIAHVRSVSAVSALTARLEVERGVSAEKLGALKESFAALSSNALRQNSETFISLAKASLGEFQRPIKETLERFDTGLSNLEKRREEAYGALRAQVTGLGNTEEQLRAETAKLVTALRTPHVGGRWGEMQLRRVVEIAEMLNHCDFLEQPSVMTEDGPLRPDMVINLPGEKRIIVDAKTPLDAYLSAIESEDDKSRKENLQRFVNQIRAHMTALSSKSYWNQFQPAPEFVFMFIPGESFYSAALQVDPSLIEDGVKQRVIVATPITLITLLKSVAYGWRQEQLEEDAQKIAALGKELYDRICTMGDHLSEVGGSLKKAVEKYNLAIGSLERRVLSKAREFQNLAIDATDHQVDEIDQIDAAPRLIQAPELSPPAATPAN